MGTRRQWNKCFIKLLTSVVVTKFFLAVFLDKTFPSRRANEQARYSKTEIKNLRLTQNTDFAKG